MYLTWQVDVYITESMLTSIIQLYFLYIVEEKYLQELGKCLCVTLIFQQYWDLNSGLHTLVKHSTNELHQQLSSQIGLELILWYSQDLSLWFPCLSLPGRWDCRPFAIRSNLWVLSKRSNFLKKLLIKPISSRPKNFLG